MIISAAVVDKFLRYTYDLVKLAADANTADEVEVATWNCVAPPAIAKESVTDKFKASEAEISVLANVNVGGLKVTKGGADVVYEYAYFKRG